jgi:hypothetical protein
MLQNLALFFPDGAGLTEPINFRVVRKPEATPMVAKKSPFHEPRPSSSSGQF